MDEVFKAGLKLLNLIKTGPAEGLFKEQTLRHDRVMEAELTDTKIGSRGGDPAEEVITMTTNLKRYNFLQLDPRPGAVNEKFDLGIEITIPKLLPEGIKNLDHHGPGCDISTPAAIEQALRCSLPEEGMTLATVRSDADSVGAMAALQARLNGFLIDDELVEAIASVDKHGPQAMDQMTNLIKSMVIAIGRKSADFKIPLGERVEWIMETLLYKTDMEEVRELVRQRDEEYAAAQKASTIEVLADGKIAFVQSSHRFATEIGYERAKIVVAFNPEMPVDFKDTSKGTYRKYTICKLNEFVGLDMKSILNELNELEGARCKDGLAWGGQSNIIGSPQGRDCALSADEVIEIVEKNLINS